MKIRKVTRARDVRAEMQMQEVIKQSDLPPAHASTHSVGGADNVTPSSIGAETPLAAQAKADAAEQNAKSYTDTHEGKNNPHAGSQPIDSFVTANRPVGISVGYMGFDTTLGKPVWFNGTNWVDATGAIA